MKVKDQYLKILKNVLKYNKNFSYDGSRRIFYHDSSIVIDVDLPDFIDLPIYTNNLEEILRFWTPETDVSEEVEGQACYLVLKNEMGKVKYLLSKSQLFEKNKSNRSINDLNIKESYFKFNLDYNKFNNLMKISKLLECDMVEVYSIDEHKIGLKAYQVNDKRNKSYFMEVENDHEHTDKKVRFSLNNFELIMASDYNFECGQLNNYKQNNFIKIKAFNGNIVMNYLFPCNV